METRFAVRVVKPAWDAKGMLALAWMAVGGDPDKFEPTIWPFYRLLLQDGFAMKSFNDLQAAGEDVSGIVGEALRMYLSFYEGCQEVWARYG